jgi:glycerophosphoryl diester phosphodiesterase
VPVAAARRLLRPLGLALLRVVRLPARELLLLVAALALLRWVVAPAGTALFRAALDAAGLATLTDRDLGRLAASPGALALLAAAAVLGGLGTIAWTVLLVVVAERRLEDPRPSTRQTLRRVGNRLRTFVRPASAVSLVVIALQLSVLAPLVGLDVFSPLTGGFALPPFIEREYVKTVPGVLLWCAVTGVLVYLLFRSVLAVPFAVVAGARPARALVVAVRATGRGGPRFALQLAVAVGAGVVAWRAAVETMARLVDAVVLAVPSGDRMPVADALGVGAQLALTGLSIVFGLVLALMLVGRVQEVSRSHPRPGSEVRRVEHSQPVSSARARRRKRVQERAGADRAGVRRVGAGRAPARRGAAVAGAVLALLAVSAGAAGGSAPQAEVDGAGATGHPLVIAHRGFDEGGPEGTISGLEAAARFAPDLVEIDVQQTADGDFVVSHDTNLFALSGRAVNVFDLSTEQATAVTVSMKGHSDTIPTLRAYAARAAELGVRLMVEVKVTGHETPDYVTRMLADLAAAGALEGTALHSLDPSTVAVMAAAAPRMAVGLTVAMLSGALPPCACDFYTIEQASITPELIEAAHRRGDEVYAWTVDDPLAMEALLREGVDGLVTDDPGAALRQRDGQEDGPGYEAGDVRVDLLRSAGMP